VRHGNRSVQGVIVMFLWILKTGVKTGVTS
jgi:hypothetical protein